MFDLKVINARLYPMAGDARPASARSFVVKDGRIVAHDVDAPARETFDAQNHVVLPGLIDCHTHALYASNRMQEHLLKLQGTPYADIARAGGGGIMSTVRAVRTATEDDLIHQTLPRLNALAAEGVTTVEIKSGYGLTSDDELKMLRAINRLGRPNDLPKRPSTAPALQSHDRGRGFRDREKQDVFPEAYRDVFMSADGRYAAGGRMPERHTAVPETPPPIVTLRTRDDSSLTDNPAPFLRIIPTFLGAHTIPPDTDRTTYLNMLIDDLLPKIDRARLAETVDIFIESIAFTPDEARRLFDRARAFGMRVRAHAEQLSNCGASTVAAEYGALSCDHLEYLDEPSAEALARAGTVAVLLPGAFYFLREKRLPPIALLRKHAIPMAVATDLNPGTSPIPSLLTALHMSITLFDLTPEEALLGVTYNAARALGRDDLGALTPGRCADFTVWDIPEPAFLAYQLGGIKPQAIFIDGAQYS